MEMDRGDEHECFRRLLWKVCGGRGQGEGEGGVGSKGKVCVCGGEVGEGAGGDRCYETTQASH